MSEPQSKNKTLANLFDHNRRNYHSGNQIYIRKPRNVRSFGDFARQTHQSHSEQLGSTKMILFKNKLAGYLKSNEVHSKAAAKYMQNTGVSDSCRWNSIAKQKRPSFQQSFNNFKNQQGKKKTIKQYMASFSSQKRKKHQPTTEIQRQSEGERKDASLLIVRKIKKSRSRTEGQKEKSKIFDPGSIKIPIHNTQQYYFQQGSKSQMQSSLKTQPYLIAQIDQTSFLVKSSSIDKQLINYSKNNKFSTQPQIQQQVRTSNCIDEMLQDSQQQNYNTTIHNFMSRKRMSKYTQVKRRQNRSRKREEEEMQLGPWQKYRTAQSELNL